MRILLIAYDNGSHLNFFPIGLGYLTAILEQAGHDVALYLQDIHHYPEEHLTDYLNRNTFDMVGLSFIGGYWQYRKALKISKAVNDSNNRHRFLYVIGGHGPAPEPEFFLRKTGADVACIGEGEETVLELAKGLPLGKIDGIAWRNGKNVCINRRRALIKDIDTLPLPAYHRFPMDVYRLKRMPGCGSTDFNIPILSGRGCTFKCNFCYRMDKGFRPRGNDIIIEEIQLLKKEYGVNCISFYDELLMSSVERTTSLCEDFLKHDLNIKWICNGRLNYAKPELLDLMKRSGCTFINYGIECFDDAVLKTMHKGLTTAQITRGIEATLKVGISPGLNIIFGNIGENEHTLQQGVNFLLKYDDGAQLRTIRPVTPYPGCELYYEAIKMGKLKDCEDFYENKHTNSDLLSVNFTQLTDEKFYSALHEANVILLRNYQKRHDELVLHDLDKLYKQKDASFRGFRHN